MMRCVTPHMKDREQQQGRVTQRREGDVTTPTRESERHASQPRHEALALHTTGPGERQWLWSYGSQGREPGNGSPLAGYVRMHQTEIPGTRSQSEAETPKSEFRVELEPTLQLLIARGPRLTLPTNSPSLHYLASSSHYLPASPPFALSRPSHLPHIHLSSGLILHVR